MKFTRIPETTFQKLQLNAGILLANFAPATGEVSESDILGATTGGVSFTATPTYSDFGADIDNAPVNIKYSCVMFQEIHGCFAKRAYPPAIAS